MSLANIAKVRSIFDKSRTEEKHLKIGQLSGCFKSINIIKKLKQILITLKNICYHFNQNKNQCLWTISGLV